MSIKSAKILQIFFVLAFVMGQASPACAFVSGKMSLLDICSADGSMKTIKVADIYNPLEKPTPKKPMTGKDCAFCFSQSHNVKIPLYAHVLKIPLPQNYHFIGAGTIVPVHFKLTQSQPRAPPVLS